MLVNILTGLLSLNILPGRVQHEYVFFTGGNSLMPSFIYSNFLDKLKENKYDDSEINNMVTVINNFDKTKPVLEQMLTIYTRNPNIIPISHSSGATSLINYCSKFNIKKAILLDPVDNKQLFDKDPLNYHNFDDVLILNAKKSYEWKMSLKNPIPKLPFIPIGRMKNNFKKYTEINFIDAGHCDILDNPYSNFMNNNLAEGLDDRDSVNSYQRCIVELINLFTYEKLNNETMSVIYDKYNFKYELIEN